MTDAPAPSDTPVAGAGADTGDVYFGLFNEIGILEHLARSMFEARLPDGILVSQFAVLNHLIRVKDGRNPLDLARAFQVPKTTMTHTLAVLDRHGLIRMEPDPRDGRGKLVWLTGKGRAFRDDAIARMRPAFDDLSRQFPAAEAAAVLPVLTRLRQVMDRMRDPQP